MINYVLPHEYEVVPSSLDHCFGFSCPHLDEASEFYQPQIKQQAKLVTKVGKQKEVKNLAAVKLPDISLRGLVETK